MENILAFVLAALLLAAGFGLVCFAFLWALAAFGPAIAGLLLLALALPVVIWGEFSA